MTTTDELGRNAGSAAVRTTSAETDTRRVPLVSEGAEGRLRAIVESQPACLSEVAHDGRLLAMNAANRALIGAKRPTQVLGKAYNCLVASADRDRVGDFIRRVCDGRNESLEYSVVHSDGSVRKVLSDAVPIRRTPGGTVAALMVTRDIARQKALETALRQAEDRIRQLDSRHQEQATRVQRALGKAHLHVQDLHATRARYDTLARALAESEARCAQLSDGQGAPGRCHTQQ